MVMNYDRLTGLKTDEDFFKFICPTCKKDGLKIKDLITVIPVGISIRNELVSNDDLPRELAIMYNRNPTKREAIIMIANNTDKGELLIRCNQCGRIHINDEQIDKRSLRKWLNIHLPETMNLSLNR